MRRTAKTAVYSTTELLVALFIASCCSLVCGLLAVWFDINRAEQVFRQDAKHVQSRIAERIGSTDAALTALSGLYSASERVEAHELLRAAAERRDGVQPGRGARGRRVWRERRIENCAIGQRRRMNVGQDEQERA